MLTFIWQYIPSKNNTDAQMYFLKALVFVSGRHWNFVGSSNDDDRSEEGGGENSRYEMVVLCSMLRIIVTSNKSIHICLVN